MTKQRIPLPKKTEQVFKDKKSQYDRRRNKTVSLEGSEWEVDCDVCGKFTQIQKTDPAVCPRCGSPEIETKPL